MEETICAVSTASGLGAISIIRISGPKAIKLVANIFTNKNFSNAKTHTIHYGFIKYKNQKIDEVLVSLFKSPKTYTKEDIVEINCHGGVVTTNKILNILLKKGCRLAEPGEFTKRAFLNGRIDLVEAEAVQNLLSAKSDQAQILAINQVDGALSKLIKSLRYEIVSLMANIEVNIDYPEYEDATVITHQILKPRLINIRETMQKMYCESKNGLLINDGINVSIIGSPNVGKSSILNSLAMKNKAIVTDIPGTTRDSLEVEINLNGIKLNLIDTAGIRETTDVVEKLGIEKATESITKSDLIILVLDNSKKLNETDLILIDKILKTNKEYIIFVNKNDLKKELKADNLDVSRVVYGNTMDINGLSELKTKIINIYNLNEINAKDVTYLSNARQISLIEKAIDSIDKALTEIKKEVPIDFLSIYIKEAWNYLGEIIGETYQDELIDTLFSNFCLGK